MADDASGVRGKCFLTSSEIWSSGRTAVPSVLMVTLTGLATLIA